MDKGYIFNITDFFRLKIFPIVWILFTVCYTYLWLGDYIEYKIHADQYTVIQDGRIINTRMTGRWGTGEIEFTYKYNDEMYVDRCSKYWGDHIDKQINVAINKNGKIIRIDFPFDNSILLELLLVTVSIFELWLVCLMISNRT